ncbi:MAG TPA: hypothetical protein VEI97_18260 [bacterium]|nr:hypothetical protein [bacterium]
MAQIPAVVTDEGERHNLRLAAFAGLFRHAVQGFLKAHGRLPTDLPELLDSGFLFVLPIAPPPHRYQYVENLPESEPHWRTIVLGFTPDFVELSFFRIPPGQPLDNPLGEPAARSIAVVASTVAGEQAAQDQDDPIPQDWMAYLQDPSHQPARRLEILRRRSPDPATHLAITLYDLLDVLPDRSTNTSGRLPANQEELFLPNFVPTPQLKQLQALDPATPAVATVELLMDPKAKAFLKRITVHEPAGVEIGDAVSLVLDAESTDKPRRSPLLVVGNPAEFDEEEAVPLVRLRVPRDLSVLGQTASAVEDQARREAEQREAEGRG